MSVAKLQYLGYGRTAHLVKAYAWPEFLRLMHWLDARHFGTLAPGAERDVHECEDDLSACSAWGQWFSPLVERVVPEGTQAASLMRALDMEERRELADVALTQAVLAQQRKGASSQGAAACPAAAVERLRAALQFPAGASDEEVLYAAARHFRRAAAAPGEADAAALDAVPLGPGAPAEGDTEARRAAAVLRLLHLEDLRLLQARINETISAVQDVTARPVMDAKKGKTGRSGVF